MTVRFRRPACTDGRNPIPEAFMSKVAPTPELYPDVGATTIGGTHAAGCFPAPSYHNFCGFRVLGELPTRKNDWSLVRKTDIGGRFLHT